MQKFVFIVCIAISLVACKQQKPAPVVAAKPTIQKVVVKNTAPNQKQLALVKQKMLPKDGEMSWAWPAKGVLLTRFNAHSQTLKGIDIAGREGEPVLAAAEGEVVYSGNSLRGYGNLIIIKHKKNFLSAYAHNRKNMVKEGDRVVLGQRIAEMGRTGTDKVKLHFEVRRDGKPIDPQGVLPTR